MKKNENSSVFDEVMPQILLVRFFSGHGVDITVHDVVSSRKLYLNDYMNDKYKRLVIIKVGQ